ncbi:MAG TPA: NADP-dependent oxidoreductase, partial [Pseudomonadales bacterium]|nr:NADP-dependent oxidoreductase [Pseudomonadales bacterium]
GFIMKAIQISEFGEPDVLRYIDVPIPEIAPDQVLVRVNCAGVNPIDYKTRKGLGFVANYLRDKLPWIPGFDFAGEIVRVGSQVSAFAVDDAVLGFANFPQGGGAYAEYLAVGTAQIVKKPASVSFATAGALPVAGLTAYQALFDVAALSPGQRVLILAGAGGVGHLAIQLAKLHGAQVAATASQGKLVFLSELGADLALDYTNTTALQSAGLFDVIIDNMGGSIGLAALAYLAAKGTLVTIPTVTAAEIIQQANQLGKKALGLTVRFDAGQLTELVRKIATGEMRLHIDKSYLLREAGLAHHDIEQGRTTGKRVLLAN